MNAPSIPPLFPAPPVSPEAGGLVPLQARLEAGGFRAIGDGVDKNEIRRTAFWHPDGVLVDLNPDGLSGMATAVVEAGFRDREACLMLAATAGVTPKRIWARCDGTHRVGILQGFGPEGPWPLVERLNPFGPRVPMDDGEPGCWQSMADDGWFSFDGRSWRDDAPVVFRTVKPATISTTLPGTPSLPGNPLSDQHMASAAYVGEAMATDPTNEAWRARLRVWHRAIFQRTGKGRRLFQDTFAHPVGPGGLMLPAALFSHFHHRDAAQKLGVKLLREAPDAVLAQWAQTEDVHGMTLALYVLRAAFDKEAFAQARAAFDVLLDRVPTGLRFRTQEASPLSLLLQENDAHVHSPFHGMLQMGQALATVMNRNEETQYRRMFELLDAAERRAVDWRGDGSVVWYVRGEGANEGRHTARRHVARMTARVWAEAWGERMGDMPTIQRFFDRLRAEEMAEDMADTLDAGLAVVPAGALTHGRL